MELKVFFLARLPRLLAILCTGVGMGKDFSENLGVNYKLVLFAGLTISAMITASVVTVVGQISYIGLIIPNIVAMFFFPCITAMHWD